VSENTGFTVLFASLIAVAVIARVMLIARSQRRRRRAAETPINYDFTVGELVGLLQAGKITQAEFERARASVLKRAATAKMRLSATPDPLPQVPEVPKGPRGFDVVQKPGDTEDDDDADDSSSRDAR
jgi:hypothetical protein